jgi:hypothetical protein
LEYGFSGKFLLNDMGFKDRAGLEVGQIETVTLIDDGSKRVGENGERHIGTHLLPAVKLRDHGRRSLSPIHLPGFW